MIQALGYKQSVRFGTILPLLDPEEERRQAVQKANRDGYTAYREKITAAIEKAGVQADQYAIACKGIETHITKGPPNIKTMTFVLTPASAEAPSEDIRVKCTKVGTTGWFKTGKPILQFSIVASSGFNAEETRSCREMFPDQPEARIYSSQQAYSTDHLFVYDRKQLGTARLKPFRMTAMDKIRDAFHMMVTSKIGVSAAYTWFSTDSEIASGKRVAPVAMAKIESDLTDLFMFLLEKTGQEKDFQAI